MVTFRYFLCCSLAQFIHSVNTAEEGGGQSLVEMPDDPQDYRASGADEAIKEVGKIVMDGGGGE